MPGSGGGEGSGRTPKRDRSTEENRTGGKMMRTERPEFKVVYKLRDPKGSGGFRAVNPLKIAESLRGVGEGLEARILANGTLMLTCKTAEQQKKAAGVKKLAGQSVESAVVSRIEGIKGVIYGVCADITEKEMREQIRGGQVREVKRFKARSDGSPDAPVLITFEGDSLPARVFLGCLAFQVRKYERPPIRCFKCQRYGHVAAVCRGTQRCNKCGGVHDLLNCEAAESKCCNCGGSHMASFRGCVHSEKARHVQEVKEQHNISYAEAVRRIDGGRGSAGSSQMAPLPARLPRPAVPLPADSIVVQKESLMAFMADVVYATRGKGSRSDIIRAVVEAAGRFLGTGSYSPESLYEFMKGRQVVVSQSHQETERIEIDPVGGNLQSRDEEDNDDGDDDD